VFYVLDEKRGKEEKTQVGLRRKEKVYLLYRSPKKKRRNEERKGSEPSLSPLPRLMGGRFRRGRKGIISSFSLFLSEESGVDTAGRGKSAWIRSRICA